MSLLRSARSASLGCARVLGTLALWTVWLALSALLVLQVYIASTNQLSVPGFVLRSLENRLAASGLRATFGRTTFDPSGRVLIENVALSLPEFNESLISARALYVRLDPWALLVKRILPLEFRATGASVAVPAMFSPSGQAEEIVRDLDFSIRPAGDAMAIDYASGRIGNLTVAVRGAINHVTLSSRPGTPLPLAQWVAQNYAPLSRRIAPLLLQLRALDQPALQAELAPAEAGAAIVRATLLARGLALEQPIQAQATDLSVTAQLPLEGPAAGPAEIEVLAEELRLPRGVTARGVRARVRGTLPTAGTPPSWTGADLAAARIAAEGFALEDPIIAATPDPLPRLRLTVLARILGAPLSVHGSVDLRAKTAEARFAGALSSGLLDPIGARLGRDLRPFVDFAVPIRVDGAARFGPGWQFQKIEARVEAQGVKAHQVQIDEARGRIEFDGRRVFAPEAYARLGADYARGSYANDLPTHRQRFILDGRLRPLDITPWFPKAPWWKEFFGNFDFSAAPPEASVDVRGRTDTGRAAAVFVFADCAKPVFRGAAFDLVLARLFTRPQFNDGLEFLVTRGAGEARGTFARWWDIDRAYQKSLDLDLTSSLDLAPAVQILGADHAGALLPFEFTAPPALALRARFEGTKARGDAHMALQIEARADAPMRFFNFPLDRASFHADVRDGEISLDRLDVGFAGGRATGHARVTGAKPDQKLAFDATIKDGSLGRAIAAVEDFTRRRTGVTPPALSKYVAAKANVRFSANASAAGAYADPLSFRGTGSAALEGTELGEVQLLGALSRVLTFTSLRFTNASVRFQIDGGRLVFPEISVTGANSAIQASGSYGFDRHQLNFNAKIYPFQKSSSIPQRLLNLALTPFSSVLEARLTGSAENPTWSLALGLGSVLSSVPGPPAKKEAAPSPPASSAR